jgi:hypothetical protein
MYGLHRCKEASVHRLTVSQVMGSSRNAGDVNLPRKSASTRQAGAFEDPPSKNLSAISNPGFLYLLEVITILEGSPLPGKYFADSTPSSVLGRVE